ncbi:hypothetical protein [Leucobacter aridicollis]|uniref:Secreted protein n=1 Tax=Leucobacter aridicollis TaxID=283878 RepID=A0A852R5Y8_9MICO|nr:hypothetical protein [Leucobacter aridicollis]MBL3682909.1 hypothetical protein [Leucobacter aridicollis]NYD26348.1 hypothetical protein [Leucobacter aridicollis]
MRARILTGLAAVAALTLAGCSAPEPEPEELTVTAAGSRYLDAVCPVNDVWDSVDAELDRLRLAVSRGDSADTGPLATQLQALQEASAIAAESLADPAVAWPDGASSAVAAVAESLDADARQAGEVAELSAAAIADYAWEGGGAVADAAADTRAALGLPADAGAACADR